MRFFLQMGHGMLAMNAELIEQFSDYENTGVISWSRTLTPEQVERHSQEIQSKGAHFLFDPCFYMPYTKRSKILDFPYWSGFDFSTTDFTSQTGRDFCRNVIEYQVNCVGVTELIVPGRYTNVRNDEWLDMHAMFADVAAEMQPNIPIFSTVALGPDVIRDLASFEGILNEIVNYPVDGFYFLYSSPEEQYMTHDELFLTNLLSGFLSISLSGKEVILGYANQQDLIFSASGVSTIATGNFRNVRSFNPATFEEDEENDRRRKIWYYDGDSFCEFRLPELGLAYQRLSLSGRFGPSSRYSQELLEQTNPAVYRWPESLAFRHFITILQQQWMDFDSVPIEQRVDAVENMIREKKQQTALYVANGMRLTSRAAEAQQALDTYETAIDSAPRLV